MEADEPSGRADAPTLLLTKLHPPSVPIQAIVRERLFERLSGGNGLKLSLVACPAGFGKSTLLAAWCARETPSRPVAWVSVDDADNDASVLWAHIIASLSQECPGVADAVSVDAVASAPLLEVVLPRLVNALVEHGGVVLVLDDFHRLTSASAQMSVAWFVDHQPSTVQLVMSTRSDPALPLGALRARGQLLELRADDLRLSRDEADEFLNGRLGLALTPADVDLLVARTEGWPAGIYLAALSLAGKADKHALVREFDGTGTHIVDFLSTEVLAGFAPDLQTFMVCTSVLERLCAPLCDAVLGTAGSAEALQTLARSNLFLLPLDDRGRWFRFHHLFAQILRVELERREPEIVGELHRRGYEWHAEFGTTDEAIHHALAAGAFDEAARLIAETWVHYANAGRTASVLDWLTRFPAETLRGDRRLLLVEAWVSALRGREDDMRRAVARVRELGRLAEGPLPDGFASLESSLSVLQATFGWGDVSAILEHGTRSLALEGPESPWRPVLTWAIGWAHFCRGELDPAERWLTETTVIARPVDQWIVGVAAVADLSLIAGMRGDSEAQMRLATQAVDLARERGLLDAVEEGEVHTALGTALLAQGRREEALPELEKGVFLRRLWGQPLDLVDSLIALAPVVADTGDARRAHELFAEAEALLGGCPDAGVLPARLATARRSSARERPARTRPELSDRERTILRLLTTELSERQIGRELFLSFHTVHTYVTSVYRKLGVSSRAAAVALAREEHLL